MACSGAWVLPTSKNAYLGSPVCKAQSQAQSKAQSKKPKEKSPKQKAQSKKTKQKAQSYFVSVF